MKMILIVGSFPAVLSNFRLEHRPHIDERNVALLRQRLNLIIEGDIFCGRVGKELPVDVYTRAGDGINPHFEEPIKEDAVLLAE